MKTNIIILIMTSGVFGADKIEPSEDQKLNKKEGESVTLKCFYDSSSEYVYLYWYRQYLNKPLQYLLFRGARSRSAYTDTAEQRFESSASTTSTELILRETRLTDTALYYCALRVLTGGFLGDWGTDPLTFGKPISVHVLPKDGTPNSPPTLSILAPVDKTNGLDVCLAAGFYPKDGEMTLINKGNAQESVSVGNATLSKTSTYYYAAFSKDMDKMDKCNFMGKEAKAGNENVKVKPQPNCDPPAGSIQTNQTQDVNSEDPKGNYMSLLVTGLRLLLAKAVAVNVMMTVKAFIA